MISTSAPSQTLLSTIYKQSWHPLASTKHSTNNGSINNASGDGQAPFYQRNSPIQRPTPVPKGSKKRCKSPVQKERKKHPVTASGYVFKNGRLTVCETSYVKIFNNTTDTQSIYPRKIPEPVLRTWRRRLKTCLESNSRDSSVKSRSITLNQKSKRTNSPPRTLAQRRSNDTISKPYKILNYQNATLASICVQGKDPPKKTLLTQTEASLRRRTQSSCLPLGSTSPPVEHHDSNQSSSSEEQSSILSQEESPLLKDSTSCFEKENETLFRLSPRPFMEIEDDVMIDDVFPIGLDSAMTKRSFEEDEGKDFKHDFVTGEHYSCLDVTPDLEMINLDYENEDDSSLDDCDISDQETSSGEDDDPEDRGNDEEESRLAIEKYKHLYEHENVPESLSVCNYVSNQNEEEIPLEISIEDDFESNENSLEPLKYEFASFVPKQFEKYNLRELSTLPPDVNWRTIVKMSDLANGRNAWSKKHYFAKSAQNRAKKNIEDKKNLETLVDRLLVLEKLQTATTQREIIRRFHFQHIRAASMKQKSFQNKRNSFSSAANETRQVEGSNEINPPGARTPSRRRSSATPSLSRRTWVRNMTEEEQNEVQEACRSGDVDALLDNWMTKSRNTKNPGDSSRRPSESGKLIKRPRMKWNQGRFYNYTCSERSKDDKVLPKQPYWNVNRTRPTCQTCREKLRKMNHNDTPQERRRRPSTASSCPSTSRQQPITEKNQTGLTPPPKPACRPPFASQTVPSAPSNGCQPIARSLPSTEIGQLMEKNNNSTSQYTCRRRNTHVYPVLAEKRGGGQSILSPSLKILPVPFNNRPNVKAKIQNIDIY